MKRILTFSREARREQVAELSGCICSFQHPQADQHIISASRSRASGIVHGKAEKVKFLISSKTKRGWWLKRE
jgi:hypothetical protein